ncbi:MAG TPA: pyridoxal-dependent decarboxylase [Actinomycetota bacterium]|nr:pyridoxal-dependent decarboxylase [Actinomycetota bacterium]
MSPVPPPPPVPDLDWPAERARAFSTRVADLYGELLAGLRDLPVGRRWTAAEVREAVALEVPDEPMPEEELLSYLREVAFRWSGYPGHPRFYAYISGSGTVPGAAADLLAAGINMNVGGWQLAPSATEIELHLTRWFGRAFGLPEGSGGILTSGGAMATFVALKVARDRAAGWDVRRQGVRGGPPLVLYLSTETHVVSERAADMLGLGTAHVRAVPVDEGFRMRVDLLGERVRADREAGLRPFAVVGTAGTVATGAVDPLPELADLCRDEGLWFHVDAAYGGPAVLAPDLRPLLAGIERADSIAFDPHKWLYTPHSGGCVLVRDLEHLRASFEVDPTYTIQDKDLTGHGLDLGRLGPQFSRGFWALKVWVSLLAHGRSAYARRISHDAALARYLGARVEEHPRFELATPVNLSICCFRFVPEGLPEGPGREGYLSLLNRRLMTELQADGRAYCSNAVLGDRFVLRACIVNHRTEAPDLDALLEAAEELGTALDASLRPEELRSP